MANRRHLTLGLFLILAFLLAACGGADEAGSGSTPANETGAEPAVAQPTGPFSAVATSAISVDLAWDPIDGASGYWIENSFANSEWFLLAEVDASQIAYEDFLAPSNMELNYRLTPLMGETEGRALTTTVTTPEVGPNPYAIKVKLEEPDYSNIGLAIPGFDPSTFDPSTFDPSTLDLSGIDPENLNLANLGPEPVSAHQRIGPQGGSLSVTGKNGITYTLEIPPDALDFAVYFTLTPVAEIEDYPFSGGYFGAVNIQPEGIIFDAPVSITFEFPAESLPNDGTTPDVVPVAFAFEQGGQEFHLTPYANENLGFSESLTGGSTKLSVPAQQVKFKMIVVTPRSTSVGAGNAKPAEKRNQAANHPPTDSGDQAAQNSAVSQIDDELAPLVDIPMDDDLASLAKAEDDIHQYAMRRGTEIVEGMKRSTNITDLSKAISRFTGFFWTGEYYRLLPEEQDYMFDTAAILLKNWLQPVKCPSPDAAFIQAWIRRLKNPRNSFDTKLKEHMVAAYGATPLNELLRDIESVQGCSVKLIMKSTVMLGDTENVCLWQMEVSAELPLSWRNFGAGNAYLQGGPAEGEHNLVYKQPFKVLTQKNPPNDRCSQVAIGGLDQADFIVLNLNPSFTRVDPSGTKIANEDWRLRYRVGGVADEITFTWEKWGYEGGGWVAEYDTRTQPIPDPGGDRDPWGGAMALMALRGSGGWIGWEAWVLNESGEGSPIARWEGKGAYVDEGNKHSHETTLSLEPQ